MAQMQAQARSEADCSLYLRTVSSQVQALGQVQVLVPERAQAQLFQALLSQEQVQVLAEYIQARGQELVLLVQELRLAQALGRLPPPQVLALKLLAVHMPVVPVR